MSPHSLLDEILLILSAIKDDEEKLSRILSFLESEILSEIEPKNEEIKIPDKYEALVRDIAQDISCGLICHLNMDTLETEAYPQNSEMDFWDENEDDEEDQETPKYREWKNVLSFEPLQSFESFRVMEDFVRLLDNNKIQNTLIDILNRRKPFAHFNSYIHNSKYREDWFKFRSNKYEKLVREMIYDKLNEVDEK